MPFHIVQEFDHLPRIAAAKGFSTIKPIWDHPDNQELRKKRKNPNALVPGDRIFIPDKELRVESKAVDAKHIFTADNEPLVLRVKFLTLADKPLTRTCTLQHDDLGTKEEIFQKGGVFETPIEAREIRVTAKFGDAMPADPSRRIRMEIGGLEDVESLEGKRHRLNNLGYFAGFSKQVNDAQMKWAIEEFQVDNKKKHGLKVEGSLSDPKDKKAFEDALVKEHGV